MAPEIEIRGAGPVGCVLALLLHAGGRSIRIVERHGRGEDPPMAARPIALSYASRIILEQAGAWNTLTVTPIQTVHVSRTGGFGRTRMTAADAGVPALGYVIDYRALAGSLATRVEAAGIERVDERSNALAGADEPALIVHAEGTAGDAKEKRYDQTAVVALIGAEPRSAGTAYERFTSEGPLALLPLAGGYGMVWATRAERAGVLVESPPRQFLDALQEMFGERAGRFTTVEGRASVALSLRARAARASGREVYVGNSAQTLHPVAGQGLNLGLRDAWELAGAIGQTPDPGDAAVLQRYSARRRLDAFATIRVTDLLARLFIGGKPLASAAGGAAMCALDLCAPARRFLARRMMYGPSAIP